MDVGLQKSVPPQISFKTIQSYFRAAYPNCLLVRVTKNTVSKRIPNIGKYSGQSPLLAKL